MNKDNLIGVLRALPSNDASRPETARLREIFDYVEATLGAGVRSRVLLATLHEQGFTMTAKGFESAVYRIRRERAGTAEIKATAPAVQAEASARFSPAPQTRVAQEVELPVAMAPNVPLPYRRKITTTADTVRLRRPQIDLETL